MKEKQNVFELVEEIIDIKTWFTISRIYVSSCFARDFSQVKIKLSLNFSSHYTFEYICILFQHFKKMVAYF